MCLRLSLCVRLLVYICVNLRVMFYVCPTDCVRTYMFIRRLH